MSPSLITRQAAESAMEDLAKATHGRDLMLAALELELTAIRAKYDVELSGYNLAIVSLETALKAWAKKNRDEFGDAQSLELVHGRLEFRIGNPALTLIGKISWDDVMTNLCLLKMHSYIRQPPVEVDKVKLLADRGDLGEQLEAIGLRVKQTEKLSITVKTEGLT